MISKFDKIDNFAIFKNFDWNAHVLNPDLTPILFGEINVIYGRNYSGKTTLSRILRSIEIKRLPERIENPQFSILCSDGQRINEENYATSDLIIRVFNEDFIKENLKFLIDPEGEIQTFAIIGGTNTDVTNRIEALEAEIGKNDKESPTGLYRALYDASKQVLESNSIKLRANESFKGMLAKKATDRESGIKYRPELYGDQNYNITKLQHDISDVYDAKYTPLSPSIRNSLEKIISERQKPKVADIIKPNLHLNDFLVTAQQLLSQKIGDSNKIQELLSDIALNEWVKQGIKLHHNTRQYCAFCGNLISDTRWHLLFQHFDEDSRILQEKISQLLMRIEKEKEKLAPPSIDKSQFYSEFYDQIQSLLDKYNSTIDPYLKNLESIIGALNKKLQQITKVIDCPKINFDLNSINQWFDDISTIISNNNQYSSKLEEKRKNAQTELRLDSIYQFCQQIGYNDQKKQLEQLDEKTEKLKTNQDQISSQIIAKSKELESLKMLLTDEQGGVKQVNKYLNHFFGHKYLSLQAIEIENMGNKQVKFQITRQDKPAYYLSEGECSLIAFCYFIARLDDVNTFGKKPIIWIDDPISSLDSNHIYFIYSLIQAKICKEALFSQLFISTHNLDFLKYLKRLKAFKWNSTKNKNESCSRSSFMIERIGEKSILCPMPKYLKENATEFNYLFKIIYRCSQITSITDKNHSLVHDFGNNARKFLEIYLYFCYPDNSEELLQKMKRFFDPELIPAILIDRIDNEGSHGLSLEKSTGYDISPEAIDAAKCIIRQLKEKHREQYDALLKSIGAV